MTVTLPPQVEALIQAKVSSGEYPDAAAVVEEALQLLQERDDGAKLARLRAALQIGIDQIERGEVVEWTPELDQRLWDNARRRARAGDRPDPDVVG